MIDLIASKTPCTWTLYNQQSVRYMAHIMHPGTFCFLATDHPRHSIGQYPDRVGWRQSPHPPPHILFLRECFPAWDLRSHPRLHREQDWESPSLSWLFPLLTALVLLLQTEWGQRSGGDGGSVWGSLGRGSEKPLFCWDPFQATHGCGPPATILVLTYWWFYGGVVLVVT